MASTGCMNTAREPVEASVAAIFWPIWPLLPMPVTTSLPPRETVSKQRLTQSTKGWPRFLRMVWSPSISISRTSVAFFKMSSLAKELAVIVIFSREMKKQ